MLLKILLRCPYVFFGLSALWLVVASLAIAYPAQAYDLEIIRSSTGKAMFEYRYYNQGEQWYHADARFPDPGDGWQTSEFMLGQSLRDELRRAGEYWANILGPSAANSAPIPYFVGTYGAKNADAVSMSTLHDGMVYFLPTLQITNPAAFPVGTEPVSQIRMGTLDWGPALHPSNLPRSGDKVDVFTTMTHELLHSLGLGGYAKASDAAKQYQFHAEPQRYLSYLYDAKGTQAKPGMTISITDSSDPSVFVVKLSRENNFGGHAYFKGPHTAEVIGEAQLGADSFNGVPINGWENGAKIGWIWQNGAWVWDSADEAAPHAFPELSHVELANSLMSHQKWRNYTYFLEAELAILQDLGYTFDRKNNFGDSVYESDLDNWQSRHGYSARTADGKGWIANTYNDTAYGVGLHVYGKSNTLTQRHDILSSGIAGTGIRIDGAKNTLTINPGTRVHAVGDYSTGLLLAYGKKHHIIHRGDIAATGQNGIGIQLDFGDNMLGNTDAFRGSWMSTLGDKETLVPSEIAGPLATSLDISGSVAGRAAAIYVASNAYVENINIMRGASLHGDIISEWNPADPRIQAPSLTNLSTQLTFGLAPDTAGAATANADKTFSMQYTGNILGDKSLHMRLAGGSLAFNGEASVLSVINEGRLSGNAVYKLSGTPSLFTNRGVLAPGNSIGHIKIVGDFTQESAGRLEMEFSPQGSDKVSVSGAVNLAGTLALRPHAAYYASGQTLHLNSLFDFGVTPTGSFAQVQAEQPLSPTLRASVIPAANMLSATAQVYRVPNAYARYAASAHAVRLGKALQDVAEAATGDTRELITALDFSALDGSGIRHALPQLTPAPYAMLAQANAEANLSMARMALAHLQGVTRPAGEGHALGTGTNAGDAAAAESEQWSAWLMPIGGASEQQAHGELAGYNSSQVGLMGGAYRQGGDVTVGLYTALTRRQMDMWTAAGAQARTEILHLGAEALWRPQGDEGWYAWSVVQAGLENTDMRRKVAFAGYARESQSEWLGFSGTASAGGGWQWRVGDVAFGPQAGLEYTLNMQPNIEEWGGQGARLHIDAYTRHDLRGVAGLTLTWDKSLEDCRSIRGHLNAQWRQELLPSDRDMHSHFVGYGDHGVAASFERQGQGSLGLSGGLQVDVRQDVTLGAYIDADVLRSGYSNLSGGLSLRWEF